MFSLLRKVLQNVKERKKFRKKLPLQERKNPIDCGLIFCNHKREEKLRNSLENPTKIRTKRLKKFIENLIFQASILECYVLYSWGVN